jgi:tRNA (guanine9-N1)-methyltransferase
MSIVPINDFCFHCQVQVRNNATMADEMADQSESELLAVDGVNGEAGTQVEVGREISSEEVVDDPNRVYEEGKISKNQLKRLKKMHKWEEKVRYQKEQKKLKKKNKRKREDGEDVEDEEQDNEQTDGKRGQKQPPGRETIERQLFKQQQKDNFLKECDLNYQIVIDCSWEDHHSESTLKSLTQQIMYCYGSNRRYAHPSRIFVTGVGPKTTALLAKNNSHLWVGVSIHSSDFIEVLSSSVDPLPDITVQSETTTPMATESQSHPLQNIVYLSSDSEDILDELDPSATYVIGGIVDRNRFKGITHEKAQKLNLRTAKLPIKEHMKMAATHVLTINHVFDILKEYQEKKSWKETLEKVLPMRKGAQSATETNTPEHEGDVKEDGAELDNVR